MKSPRSSWFKLSLYGLIIIIISEQFWPGLIPFQWLEFWRWQGNISDWIYFGWPLLAWGVTLTGLFSLFGAKRWWPSASPERGLLYGLLLSVFAGVVEEICFRWLIFLCFIPVIKLVNFCVFGFLGLPIPELMQIYILGPIANFLTLGYLSHWLGNPENWLIGAAIMAANARFREAHSGARFIVYVNSWFVGMFMFYILFQFGLPAAIFLHIIYYALISFVRYLGEVLKRAAFG